jgi:hypothetical protein
LAVVQMRYVMRFGAYRGWGRTDRGQVLGLVAAHNRCSPLRQYFDAIRRRLGPCRTCDPAGCPVVHPVPPKAGMSGWHYKSDLDRTSCYSIYRDMRLRRIIVAINSPAKPIYRQSVNNSARHPVRDDLPTISLSSFRPNPGLIYKTMRVMQQIVYPQSQRPESGAECCDTRQCSA